MIIKDASFTNVWFNAYKKTGIHHFNYCCRVFNSDILDNTGNLNSGLVFIENKIKIVNTPRLNGCFLTFTPAMIQKIGYFRVFPFKYGHSHTNFTLRSINYGFTGKYGFVDLYDSEKYIGFNMGAIRYFANPTTDRKLEADENGKLFSKDLNTYVKISI
jgi:hypothetical protein